MKFFSQGRFCLFVGTAVDQRATPGSYAINCLPISKRGQDYYDGWDDVISDLAVSRPGHNVMVYEFAHKLDMLNGSVNHMPQPHPELVWRQLTLLYRQNPAICRAETSIEN